MTKTVLALIALFMTTVSLGQHRSADEAFSIALTGDSIINRKLSVYDEPDSKA